MNKHTEDIIGRGMKASSIHFDEMACASSNTSINKGVTLLNSEELKDLKVYAFKNNKTKMIDGYFVSKLTTDDNGNMICIKGNLIAVDSWTINTDEPIDTSFVASVYFKWDCCTHWNFNGEGFMIGDNDSYYHLCGSSFMRHISLIGLVAHVVKTLPGADRGNNLIDLDELETLGLLERYEIIGFDGVPHWVEDKVLALEI